ncbi:MAG TPA: hypothetical protein VKE94_15975 [Gemmataceae bacterium]|nr:hypothetical protein [Gemmataceae bacterium]
MASNFNRLNHGGVSAAEIIRRRAERLGATLSQADNGWTLDALPYTMGQLGYPNLSVAQAPRQVRALSLREADHCLFLCEQRTRAKQPSNWRPHAFLDQ